jgi:hypothetical protein
MRWQLLEERVPGKSAVPQVGTCQGHSYTITAVEGGWQVVHKTPAGKETLLTEKPVGYAAAYKVAVAAARGQAKAAS